jgi:hypothetical protein
MFYLTGMPLAMRGLKQSLAVVSMLMDGTMKYSLIKIPLCGSKARITPALWSTGVANW